jgi:ABC-type nitrate/sulfonate/bicarbonate transport system ATPase subunit
MIHLRNITFKYGDHQPVFHEWSWHIKKGEIWCVLGPSGCGKSTLLQLLAGLLQPQKGTVTIDGKPIMRPRPGTGLVLQEYGLLPWESIRNNVALGLRIRKFYGPDGRHVPKNAVIDDDEASATVDYWLHRLGIDEISHTYPGHVSGGQRQRAAIARAFVLEPDLLLMDEPFSALDAPTRENLESLTLTLSVEMGLTVVLVTHSIEEATYVGQHILVLQQPPNKNTLVHSNPHQTEPSYRNSSEYRHSIQHLYTMVVDK